MKITPFQRIQGWGLSTYAMLAWRTARFQVKGQEYVTQVHESGRSLLLAAWHGMTMMFTGYLAAHEDLRKFLVVVPDDPRGAVLSIWVERMKGTPFTISMEANSMVAGRRLLALIRQMKQGKHLYLNPDGPYGPSHEPKRGVAFIARKSGALIIPSAAYTDTCYRVPRWDRYVVPLPYSRISIVMGEPLEIPPKADLELARTAIRERLNQVEREAEELYRSQG